MATTETRTDECCSPLVRAPLESDDAERLAASFKALADATRLRLLAVIAATDEDEACVCDLTAPVDLSQPTVSHHLRILVDAGLLTREKRGRWSYYAVVPGALEELGAVLVAPARTPGGEPGVS